MYVYIYIWISTYSSHLFTFFPFSFGDLGQDVRQRLQLLIQHVKGFAALAQVQQRHGWSTRAKLDVGNCRNVGIAAHHCQETSVYKTNEKSFFSLLHVLYLQLTAAPFSYPECLLYLPHLESQLRSMNRNHRSYGDCQHTHVVSNPANFCQQASIFILIIIVVILILPL